MTWAAVIETVQKYFLTAFCGLVVTLLGLLWKKINQTKEDQKKAREEQKKEDEYMKEALKAILRDRIFYVCNTHLKSGTITTSEYDVITSMEKIYESLGGNSVAKAIYERMGKHCKIIIEENS